MTKNRLHVLRYFISGKRNGVNYVELLRYFFDISYSMKAKKCITKIEKWNDFYLIFFNIFSEPLFYPIELSIRSLYQVIVESFYPGNWHYYEIPQTRVDHNDIVVDCGAAEGLFGFIVQHRCKKLYLIEPLPIYYDALQHSLSEKVNIFKVAISDKESMAKITHNDISSSIVSTGIGTDVHVTTLDKLFYDTNIPVSFIKMDLEGYDYFALQGGRELIRRNKPKIAVTTYHQYEHAQVIAEYLRSIVPEYNILTKGIYQKTGSPIMLHAWI